MSKEEEDELERFLDEQFGKDGTYSKKFAATEGDALFAAFMA
jgi:hypothetical protein